MQAVDSTCSKNLRCPFWVSSKICPIWTCPMARAWTSLGQVVENNWHRLLIRPSSARYPLTRMYESAATPENQLLLLILIQQLPTLYVKLQNYSRQKSV